MPESFDEVIYGMFPFLIGRIRTSHMVLFFHMLQRFPFLIGRIRTS
ncbi:MAG TPA: hypothetical protein PLK32_07215 [Defluviitoga tunisiensis]|nr:hypothetical protein [Defluviitoga tunisiensis]